MDNGVPFKELTIIWYTEGGNAAKMKTESIDGIKSETYNSYYVRFLFTLKIRLSLDLPSLPRVFKSLYQNLVHLDSDVNSRFC